MLALEPLSTISTMDRAPTFCHSKDTSVFQLSSACLVMTTRAHFLEQVQAEIAALEQGLCVEVPSAPILGYNMERAGSKGTMILGLPGRGFPPAQSHCLSDACSVLKNGLDSGLGPRVSISSQMSTLKPDFPTHTTHLVTNGENPREAFSSGNCCDCCWHSASPALPGCLPLDPLQVASLEAHRM